LPKRYVNIVDEKKMLAIQASPVGEDFQKAAGVMYLRLKWFFHPRFFPFFCSTHLGVFEWSQA
jgi:hypothetical protein